MVVVMVGAGVAGAGRGAVAELRHGCDCRVDVRVRLAAGACTGRTDTWPYSGAYAEGAKGEGIVGRGRLAAPMHSISDGQQGVSTMWGTVCKFQLSHIKSSWAVLNLSHLQASA